MPPKLACLVFQPEEGMPFELAIRTWALFLSYLKTLGKDSLKFLCSMLRYTEVLNQVLAVLVTHLPQVEGRQAGRRAGGGKKQKSREEISEDASSSEIGGADAAGEGEEADTILALRDVVTNARLLGEEEYVVCPFYSLPLHPCPYSL